MARWVTAMLVVLAADAVLGRCPLWARAVLDEVAHLATAALLWGARPAVMLGAVTIDLDHLLPWSGGGRPGGHSLWPPLVLGVTSRGAPRDIGLGIAAHLVRDAATGGVPWLWPLGDWTLRLPYTAYAVGLALLVCYRSARRCG